MFVAPGPGCRRYNPRYPRIVSALFLVLVLALAGCTPVTAVTVDGQVLGRTSGTDPVIEPTLEFARDDIVTSDVYLKDAGEGDILEWAFTGPHEMIYNESQSLTTGQSVARTTFDLGLLSTNEAVGLWTLDISLNGEQAVQQDFTVEPLTGLVWWGPFAGAAVLAGLVALVVILVVAVIAGIVLLLQSSHRKGQK